MSEKQHSYDLPEESGGVPRELFIECVEGLISDEEEEALLLNFLHGRGGRATEEEVEELFTRARAAVVTGFLVRLAAEGLANISLDEDGELAFSLTEKAKARADALVEQWKAAHAGDAPP